VPRGERLDRLAPVLPDPAGGTSAAPDHADQLVGKAGPEVFEQLNAALVGKLAEDRLLRARKLRMTPPWWKPTSTTPLMLTCWNTESVSWVAGSADQRRRGGRPDPFRDRSRSAGRRIKQISRTLRRRTGQALGEIDRLTGEIADIATRTLTDVAAVTRNARRP